MRLSGGSATVVFGLAMVTLVQSAGCAHQSRKWSYCALGGAVIGAGIGAGTAVLVVKNAFPAIADPIGKSIEKTRVANAELYAALGAGVTGGIIGGIAGHYICDPKKEDVPRALTAVTPPNNSPAALSLVASNPK
jgi:hypothetical protein